MAKKEEFEYSDVVDQNNLVIGKATREELHSGSNLLHRSVDVFIFNDENKILIPKRSKHKINCPGCFDCSAHGHVISGETYSQAAHRELKEELGFDVPLKRIGEYRVEMKTGPELAELFVGTYAGKINFEKKEVEEIYFLALPDIEELIATQRVMPNLPKALDCYKKAVK